MQILTGIIGSLGLVAKWVLVWLIVLPTALYGIFFALQGWPSSWASADWSSTNTAPDPGTTREAVVRIYAARTGRWKGIFATHNWLAVKPRNGVQFDRYDVVGWGRPIRRNAYAVDARWYSNPPRVVYELRGQKAQRLIPQILQAVRRYPYNTHGSYRIWPGPNSNSFIGWIARQVPELAIEMDPTAIGKDFIGRGFQIAPMPSNTGWQMSWNGLIGAGLARVEGIELHLLGATIGVGFDRPAIKLPGIGRLDMEKLKYAWRTAVGGVSALAAYGVK